MTLSYPGNRDSSFYKHLQVYLREEPYEWTWPPPAPPRSLYIYESHVGICTPRPAVSSYLDYADTVIPRIAKLGYNAVQLMAVMEHAYYASFGYQVSEKQCYRVLNGNGSRKSGPFAGNCLY